MIGNILGDIFIGLSFVSACAISWSGLKVKRHRGVDIWFCIHTFSVIATILTLYFLIFSHHYDYDYVRKHVSNTLSVPFLISCFWEGQEGSFLLWIFFNTCIAFYFIRKKTTQKGPILSAIMMVQVFLISMLLGWKFGNVEIGASPFQLVEPSLIGTLQNGNGLNPLLQNYWMVIHPPIIFLGFALLSVPFYFLFTAAILRKKNSWVRPALIANNLALAILGIGIMMGAYWAYETLNFEGYWSWDPVENAVYLPWLASVLAVHIYLVFIHKKRRLKSSMLITIASFLLVLYASFLTRSGVLGNSSVHAFVDNGLTWQLLSMVLFFTGLSIWTYRRLTRKSNATYVSFKFNLKESWIYIGGIFLFFAIFHVLFSISLPVFSKFIQFFGVDVNLDPPTDDNLFYTKTQGWLVVGMLIAMSFAMLKTWYTHIVKYYQISVFVPLVISLTLGILFVFINTETRLLEISLFFSACLAMSSLISYWWKSKKFTPVFLTHFGVVAMIVGFLMSSSYAEVLTTNKRKEQVSSNIYLEENKGVHLSGMHLTYAGRYVKDEKTGRYIHKNNIVTTGIPNKYHTKQAIWHQNKMLYKAGDELTTKAENSYCGVHIHHNGEKYTGWTRIQRNGQMGVVISPDIHHQTQGDNYMHVTNFADFKNKEGFKNQHLIYLKEGEFTFSEKYRIALDSVRIFRLKSTGPKYVRGYLTIKDQDKVYQIQPTVLAMPNKTLVNQPDLIETEGIKMNFVDIDYLNKEFSFNVAHGGKNWATVKIVSKPWMGLIWGGTLLFFFGAMKAFIHRQKIEKSKQEKYTTIQQLRQERFPSNEENSSQVENMSI